MYQLALILSRPWPWIAWREQGGWQRTDWKISSAACIFIIDLELYRPCPDDMPLAKFFRPQIAPADKQFTALIFSFFCPAGIPVGYQDKRTKQSSLSDKILESW